VVNAARADHTATAVLPSGFQRRIDVVVLVAANFGAVGHVSRYGDVSICADVVTIIPFGPSRSDEDRDIPRVVAGGVGGVPSEFELAG
jgi:hypothetical protein